MNEIKVKLMKGGRAGPFQVATGTKTRVLVQRPTFEAVVLDELGGPVPDVLVSVRFSNGQLEEHETDASGRVRFPHDFPEESVSMTLPNLDGSLWDLDPVHSPEDAEDH